MFNWETWMKKKDRYKDEEEKDKYKNVQLRDMDEKKKDRYTDFEEKDDVDNTNTVMLESG